MQELMTYLILGSTRRATT